jgi:hypothetical protein
LVVSIACTDQSVSATLGPSKASALEGLPVPRVAQLIPSTDKSQGPVSHAEYYGLPRSVSINALDRWYSDHLVQGRSWHGWMACQHPLYKPNAGTERAWIHGSTILLLATGDVGNGQVQVAITEQTVHGSAHVTC